MASPRTSIPALRCHISGQAICTIAGRDFYLGKHGSVESLARYAVLVADYQRFQLTLPADYSLEDVDAKAAVLVAPIAPTHQADAVITMRHLTAGYREHIKKRYDKPHQATELGRRMGICDELDLHDGTLPAASFGSRKLKEHRERFVAAGDKSRKYINRLITEIRRVFRWGVTEELVDPDVLVRLKSLDPLVGGEAAYETDTRFAVPIEHLRATAIHLTPIVRDMVTLQLATGMRSSEVCSIRPCDIDRSREDWIYLPVHHKTKWKGQKRVIPLIGEARQVIEAYITRHADQYCFSPAESMAWFRAKLKAECKGSGSYKKPKLESKRLPRAHYDSNSYRQSIQSAAKAAGVPS